MLELSKILPLVQPNAAAPQGLHTQPGELEWQEQGWSCWAVQRAIELGAWQVWRGFIPPGSSTAGGTGIAFL